MNFVDDSELPRNWEMMTLAELNPGRGRSTDPRKDPDQEFELYSVPNFPIGRPQVLKGSEIGSSKQSVDHDTVLLCGINPRINRVWVVSKNSGIPQIASTEWITFPPVGGILPEYLCFFLQQNRIRDYLASRASGVGGSLMRVKGSTCAALQFPVAPTGEQGRIVSEIEKQFTRLDAAVEALKRAKANLKRYRASVLKAACEGRLVPTEAELARRDGSSYEPASELLKRILAERRARWEADQLAKFRTAGKEPKNDRWKLKYEEPSASNIAELPELANGWIWSSIGQLFEVCIGATPRRGHPEFWNGDVPWVSSGEVSFCRIRGTRESITLMGLKHSSTQLHPPGTVLLGMIGEGKTRGQAAILEVDACNNQNAAAIRVSDTGLPPEYMYYYLQARYEETRRMSSGGNQPALNKERVRSITIPLPPLAEQKRIVTEVERRLSVVDELVMQVEANLKRAERLRQAILKRTFEGKLVPQDLDDEPASILLERIRTERAEPLNKKKSRSSQNRNMREATTSSGTV